MKKCTGCGEVKGEDQFGFVPSRGRTMTRCKVCRAAYARKWRRPKPGYESARYQATKAETRERHLRRKYGIDLAEYDRMLALQGGCCAICNSPEAEQFKGVLHVDHDHKTGAVRGLLCRGCNHMLGAVGDDPAVLARAIKYLVPQVAAEFIKAFEECRP